MGDDCWVMSCNDGMVVSANSELRVSVVMSVFDNAAYLAPAIESILAQTSGDFEFLIVDDGSTDGSGAIIDRYAARDSRMRVTHQSNQGLIASLNTVIGAARAPLIARMDGDDIALPDRFERQLAFLDARPEVGVLGTGCTSIDEAGEPSRRTFDNVTEPHELLEDLRNGPPLCHPSVMMRRDAVQAVGGYHAAYRHCEDYDLWLRLSRHVAMANLPDRLLLYRQSSTQVSNRHALAQQLGAAIAWEAHVERLAGRPDPTDALTELPALTDLDRVFGRPGVERAVRAKVARSILYSKVALRGDGLGLVLDNLAQGGSREGLWRTVMRLITFGEPARAARLAGALVRT